LYDGERVIMKFRPSDLVLISFATDKEVGFVVEAPKRSQTYNVLVDGEIYRATESMLEHVKDEEV